MTGKRRTHAQILAELRPIAEEYQQELLKRSGDETRIGELYEQIARLDTELRNTPEDPDGH